eukprot:5407512-Pyramimonas_sp.AAC.1
MWPPPLRPSVEFLMGPRSAVLGVAGAFGHPHWALGGAPYRGHEALYWVLRTHVATPLGF